VPHWMKGGRTVEYSVGQVRLENFEAYTSVRWLTP
jgi:hypothetical protein